MTAAAAVLLGTSGCGQMTRRPLAVTHGWIRLPANPAAPAAAYFTLEGGHAADALTGVSTDRATKAEMHRTMAMGDRGMTGMAPLRQVPLPAGATVVFAPGERHVMLFGLSPAVKAGDTVAVTFSFASGARMTAPAKVVGPADPAPL